MMYLPLIQLTKIYEYNSEYMINQLINTENDE